MTSTGRSTDQPIVRTAAYLRCFPYDAFRVGPHRNAVLAYAEEVSLPIPAIYFDNGCLSSGALPELERLLHAITAGNYDAVIVPGPFVFSLDDHKAHAVIREISHQGCQVMEVPSLKARAEARKAALVRV
jgi:DNA invertase Pin-like site-specific DNA recombinase